MFGIYSEDQMKSMGMDTLTALLKWKLNPDSLCYNFVMNPKMLRSGKQTTQMHSAHFYGIE